MGIQSRWWYNSSIGGKRMLLMLKVDNDKADILDTDDMVLENVSFDDIRSYKNAGGIIEEGYDFHRSNNIIVAYHIEVSKQGYGYDLKVYVGIENKGALRGVHYKNLYGFPNVSLYGNEVRISYYDKHYYHEDMGETFEVVWTIDNGKISGSKEFIQAEY